MSALLALPVIQELGKFALKEAAKSAGGRTAKFILFEVLFEDQATKRLGEINEKLDAIEKGQQQLLDQISTLHERVGLKSSLEAIHNEVHGVLLTIKSKTVTDKDFKSLNRFLALTGKGSARLLADDLHQKLFGTGEITPDHFWIGDIDDSRGAAGNVPHRDSHVGMSSAAIFNSNGSAPVDEYVPRMLLLYADIINQFAVLGAAIQVAKQFLDAKGRLDDADRNALLFSGHGLAGMMQAHAIRYIVNLAPSAFYLYKRMFLDRQWQRIGLDTKSRNRMLEWDASEDRRPVERVSGGLTPTIKYEISKPVYADHPARRREPQAPSHLWWHLGHADGDGPSYCLVLRTDDDPGKFLGVFSYKAWTKTTKSGPHITYSDEVGLGGDRGLGACRWRLHLRRGDDKAPEYFLLESLHTGKFLNIHGGESWKTRQVFVDGENLAHDDKAFHVIFPVQ